MDIVYINLDKRPDRRVQMEREFERLGLKARRFAAVEAQPGGVGCALSHAAVLKQAIDDGSTELLVIEDDLEFWDGGAALAQRLGSFRAEYPTYDVLMLDYALQAGTELGDWGGRVHAASTTGAYLVARHYMPTLHQCFMESALLFQANPTVHWLFSCDQYWKRLQQKDSWYYLTPRACSQRSGYSDICECHVEHTYAERPKHLPTL